MEPCGSCGVYHTAGMRCFDKQLAEALARCLSRMDGGGFISAVDWQNEVGDDFRRKAAKVLETLALYEAGHRSGGL